MNIADFIVLGLIILWVGISVYFIFGKKKTGCSGCCCNCSGCEHSDECGKK